MYIDILINELWETHAFTIEELQLIYDKMVLYGTKILTDQITLEQHKTIIKEQNESVARIA